MINWVIRYAPVVRFLRRIGTTDVLEVGSGSWGLAEFVEYPVTGCDVAFDANKSTRLRPVVGSITDLPFADGQFECVVCLDTLEHLSPQQRERAIQELIRVTGTYLVVGCPAGEWAERIDRKLYTYFCSRPGGAPDWLCEHMEHPFPRKLDIARLLTTAHLQYRMQKSEAAWAHYLVIRAEMTRWIGGVLTRISHMKPVQRYFPALAPALTIGHEYRPIFFAQKMG